MREKLLFLLAILFLASCASRKEIVYFQGIENIEGTVINSKFEPVFESNDVLQIDVSSMDPAVVAPFLMNVASQNQSSGSSSRSSSSGSSGGGGRRNSASIGYLVDVKGNIQFPVLGQVEVAGKSRSELEAHLTREIKKYVRDAVVAVRLINFRVIVLGESGSQSVVQVENERISVPELLANVGGITYDGMRDNILVIREIDGVITHGYLDMTSADIFKNPYYYLKQNDIVYVEPTYKQVKSAGWITSWQGILSVITSAVSLYFITQNF
ncbi:polysaccharide biosynthesis/export family protein [Antarcticibacterium sp. 1MA-6-2]|uniref:polysaccharide biosynthesis/export family protein n=1 Tax=Antarcticibacterium sp. 1MA-6-2 TaxID=2908210 RepID=UPI001F47597B|nr:polysaccharide biosynthesis/export family protein [Antarcticibacterium sp. 1MA-6-2]UJH91335.1 polysaccharide biosynthesis/export family protein [Antarcticibacterium sp. 1MA-6-2]